MEEATRRRRCGFRETAGSLSKQQGSDGRGMERESCDLCIHAPRFHGAVAVNRIQTVAVPEGRSTRRSRNLQGTQGQGHYGFFGNVSARTATTHDQKAYVAGGRRVNRGAAGRMRGLLAAGRGSAAMAHALTTMERCGPRAIYTSVTRDLKPI